MYLVKFSKMAEKDKGRLKNAGLVFKAKALLDVISQNPFQNPPPYERLVGNLEGFYSRRINIKHRLVYEVYIEEIFENEQKYDGLVKVARMWSQYE